MIERPNVIMFLIIVLVIAALCLVGYIKQKRERPFYDKIKKMGYEGWTGDTIFTNKKQTLYELFKIEKGIKIIRWVEVKW